MVFVSVSIMEIVSDLLPIQTSEPSGVIAGRWGMSGSGISATTVLVVVATTDALLVERLTT